MKSLSLMIFLIAAGSVVAKGTSSAATSLFMSGETHTTLAPAIGVWQIERRVYPDEDQLLFVAQIFAPAR